MERPGEEDAGSADSPPLYKGELEGIPALLTAQENPPLSPLGKAVLSGSWPVVPDRTPIP